MTLFPRLGTHWPFRYSLLVKMSIGIASSSEVSGILPYMSMAAILPSWSCDQHYLDKFSFSCIYKLTSKICLKMAQCLLKSNFNFLYVNDIRPRSRNDFDLQYSNILINTIIFRSQAAIVFESYKLQKLTFS